MSVPSVAPAPIWWSNAIFFCAMHFAAAVGVYMLPLWTRRWQTRVLCIASWQLAVFGITIGYHRLWSHRSFTAKRPLRVVLALMGCLGFQGSIKWWCGRHRLHHRFTDDPIHDPYSATKGLLHSHMGWIFRKPVYPRLALVDRSDLDRDPVVRFQHENYLALTLGLGLVLPTILGYFWNDPWGGLVWGGIVARLLIWHCTFIVNSFAHWNGLQPYSDEMTARGNLLMAVLTGGEGNHNYHHAFPHDFRAGPSSLDWDPSKWIINVLYHYTTLVTSVKIADADDVERAKQLMTTGHHHHHHEVDDSNDSRYWGQAEISDFVAQGDRTIVFIDGWVVDVTEYMSEHPGGYALLRTYATRTMSTSATQSEEKHLPVMRDASWAFGGGLNNHTRSAKGKMRQMRVARVDPAVQLVQDR